MMLALLASICCGSASSVEYRLLVPDTALQSMAIVDQQDKNIIDIVYRVFDANGIAAHPRRALAYVAGGVTNEVVVVNTLTRKVVDRVPVGNYASGVIASNDGAFIYTSNSNGASVSVIDTDTNEVVATIPVGNGPTALALDNPGAYLYVSSTMSGDITVVNLQSRQVVANIHVGGYPRAIAFSSDGSMLYVSNAANRNVSVVDVALRSVVKSLSIGAAPAHLAMDPGGQRLFVGTINVPDGDFVYVIDTASFGVVRSVRVPGQMEGLSISRDGSELYAIVNSINFPRGRLMVFDAAQLSHLQTVPAGAQLRAFGNFVVPMPDRAMLVALVQELQVEVEGIPSIDPTKAQRLKALFVRAASSLEVDGPAIATLCMDFERILFFLRQAWLDGQLPVDKFRSTSARMDAIARTCGCSIEPIDKGVLQQAAF